MKGHEGRAAVVKVGLLLVPAGPAVLLLIAVHCRLLLLLLLASVTRGARRVRGPALLLDGATGRAARAGFRVPLTTHRVYVKRENVDFIQANKQSFEMPIQVRNVSHI